MFGEKGYLRTEFPSCLLPLCIFCARYFFKFLGRFLFIFLSFLFFQDNTAGCISQFLKNKKRVNVVLQRFDSRSFRKFDANPYSILLTRRFRKNSWEEYLHIPLRCRSGGENQCSVILGRDEKLVSPMGTCPLISCPPFIPADLPFSIFIDACVERVTDH